MKARKVVLVLCVLGVMGLGFDLLADRGEAESITRVTETAGDRPPAQPSVPASVEPAACPRKSSPQVLSPPGWQMSLLSEGKWQQVPGAARVAQDQVWQGSQSVQVGASREMALFFWQAIDAKPFRGKRVAVSASLRTQPEEGSAFLLFVRAFSGSSLNVYSHANPKSDLGGDSPGKWVRWTVFIEVPAESDVLLYGLRLRNAWVDTVRVEAVGDANGSLPTSSLAAPGSLAMPVPAALVLPEPQNLDFEEPGMSAPQVPPEEHQDRC